MLMEAYTTLPLHFLSKMVHYYQFYVVKNAFIYLKGNEKKGQREREKANIPSSSSFPKWQ